jgi:RNA polymerase sigma factor (sigma-70 family)
MPDAEQAAVDIAYLVVNKLKTEHVDSLRGWIRRICRNTCFSLLRKEFPPVVGSDSEAVVPRLHFESLNDRHLQIPDTSFYSLENDLPGNESKTTLNLEDLSGLTDREKKIVALFLAGNRPAEIAQEMGITVNNVRASWNQLLKKLRKLRTQ